MICFAFDASDGWYLFIALIVVLGRVLDPLIDWLAGIIVRRRERNHGPARGR